MKKWSVEKDLKSMLERRRLVCDRVTKSLGHLSKEQIIMVCLGNMTIEKAEAFAEFQEQGNIYANEEETNA